jgi:small-conductance mechanosensitive channel
MKKIILLLITVLCFAAEGGLDAGVKQIIENIPKNSPNYSLDVALAQKIKELKFIKPDINTAVKNQKGYLDAFYTLIKLDTKLNTLPKKINEINDKLSILQNLTDPTSKLQYLYYEKLLEIYNKTFTYLNNNFGEIEKTVQKKLFDIGFDTKQAQNNIRYWRKLLTEKQREFERLNIDLQKWQVLNSQKNIENIQKLIDINLQKQKGIYKHLFENQTVIWLNDLKTKDKKAFDDDDNILIYARHIGENFYNSVNQIVTDFENYTFGTKALVYGAKKEAEITFDKMISLFNYPLFTVGNRIITPLNFALFILILVIGWFVGKYYKYLIYRLRHSKNISYSTATLLANMGYYAILTLSFLIALKVVGLDLSSLAIIAGALSVGIGFGLQNVVSNFVSGIILMFERTIKVGDYIQIDQDTRGEVVDISMRSTVIRTNDNINLIIPNQSFIQNNVINWTLGDDIVRFRVPFGVAYGSDIHTVEKVVLEALRKSNLPYIKKHPTLDITPLVVFMEMGDSSLNFELFIWVKGEYARRPRRTRSAFLKMIYDALNEAGINIPFPQQDLHIKDSVPFEIRIKKD